MFKFFSPAWLINNLFTLSFGGGGTPAPTNTTVQNTNIPDYAQPYVMNMLGATENQLFNKDASGNITGFAPYSPYSTDPSQYVAGFSPLQQQAQNTAANMQLPGQFGQASQMSGMSGMGSLGLANQATGYGGASAATGMGGLGFGQQAAGYGGMGAQAGQQATGYGAMGAGFGQQAGQAGNQYANAATNGSIGAYMNPYLQQSLDPQLAEIRRQYGITGTQEQGQATQAGAMGGSREALMAAENQRNMGTAQSQAIAQGYNNAFNQAQQAQQFGANLGLQGQQAGIQGAQAGIAGQGAAMQGAGLGIQGAQAGMQGINTALSGLGQGISGVNAGLAGMGQANAAAGTLGQLGTAQQAAQQGIIGTQSTMGQQQQTQQQNITNQAIQNYANAQQYPMMQLGMMSNMLRGLPMQGMTTQQYQAQPSMTNQLVGLTGALANQAPTKTAKAGGIMQAERFDVGGAIKADISKLPTDKLQAMMGTTPSPIVKGDIRAELGLRAQGASQDFAKGGILSFYAGTPKNAISDVFGGVPEDDTSPTLLQRSGIPEAVSAGWCALQSGAQRSVDPAFRGKEYAPEIQVSPESIAQSAAQVKQAAAPAVDTTKKEAPVVVAPRAGVLDADVAAPSAFNWEEATKLAGESISPEQRAALSGETKVPDVGQSIADYKAMQERFTDPALAAARRADRAEAMATKANIKDELARREQAATQNMWARIGATPGPLIAAGLKSMIEKNGEDLQNTQWGKDAMKDANTLIAKFNDSDYMIQQGDIAGGYAQHEQAIKDLKETVNKAELAKEKSMTQQRDVYKDTVRAYQDEQTSNHQRAMENLEGQRIGIERTKANALGSKEDVAREKNFATMYDAAFKTAYAANPETAAQVALNAANLIYQKGPKSVTGAGSFTTDPKTGEMTYVRPQKG